MTPLHQFKGVPADVIRKAEGKQFVSNAVFRFLCVHNSVLSLGIGALIW